MTIKEKLKVPSAALQAMVDGLRNTRGLKIDMYTFGRVDGSVCFGCAATCTVQEIVNKAISKNNLDEITDHYKDLGFTRTDVVDFEYAIDDARCGALYRLFEYFSIGEKHTYKYDNRFSLGTESFLERLPAVEKLITELKEIEL